MRVISSEVLPIRWIVADFRQRGIAWSDRFLKPAKSDRFAGDHGAPGSSIIRAEIFLFPWLPSIQRASGCPRICLTVPLSRLTGRGVVEFTVEKGDGSTFFPSAGGEAKSTATIQVCGSRRHRRGVYLLERMEWPASAINWNLCFPFSLAFRWSSMGFPRR